jgi:hypothetical protein
MRTTDMRQLALPLEIDEKTVLQYLEKAARKPVKLTVTDNAASLISVKPVTGGLDVRLHRIFLQAGRDVLDEIGLFVKQRGGKTPAIREFIRDYRHQIPESRPRRQTLQPHGQFFDLDAVFHKLNMEYFENRVTAAITWGKSRKKRVVRRTLGSYSSQTNTISINPILDRRSTPRYVIEHVVHHEMLHADLGISAKNGRRGIHTKEFRYRERMFKDYDRAAAWCL